MNHFSLSHSLLFHSEMLRDCPVKQPLNLLASQLLPLAPDSGHSGGWRDSECGLKVLGADVPSGLLFSCQSHGLPREWTPVLSFTLTITLSALCHSAFETEGGEITHLDRSCWLCRSSQGLNPGSLPCDIEPGFGPPRSSLFLFYPMRIVMFSYLSGRCGCWRNF